MRTASCLSRPARRAAASILLAALALFVASAAATAEMPPDCLPADALVYLEIADVNALRDRAKQTDLWGLYEDPAMQRVIRPGIEHVRERFQESLNEGFEEMGLEEPMKVDAFFELLEPRSVKFAMVPVLFTGTRPLWKFEDGEWIQSGETEYTSTRPGFLLVMDMGEKAGRVRKFIEGIFDAQARQEGMIRQKQTVRGVKVQTLGRAETVEDLLEVGHSGSVAFLDSLSVVGFGCPQAVKETVLRLRGADLPALEDSRELNTALRAVGTGEVRAFINGPAIVEARVASEDEEDRQSVRNVIRGLGLENVSGALAVQLAPAGDLDLVVRGLATLPPAGQRRGIPQMLTPNSGDVRPPEFAHSGLESLGILHVDARQIYEGIRQIAATFTPLDLDMQIKSQMALTAGSGEDARQPVDFQQEVIDQLTGPITFTLDSSETMKALSDLPIQLRMGVRDSAVLDAALARLHETFLAPRDPNSRERLLDTNLYLLPGPFAGPQRMGFAVVGGRLIFGGREQLQQEIRDVRRDVQHPPLAADAAFRAASRYLPARAGGMGYADLRRGWRPIWEQLREAATNRSGGEGTARPEDDGPAEMFEDPLEELEDIGVDLADLPAFSQIQKYFGASLRLYRDSPEGLRLEYFLIRGSAVDAMEE